MESPEKIIEDLIRLYDESVERLRADIVAFAREGTLPKPEKRSDGSYAYPEIRLRFRGGARPAGRPRSFVHVTTAHRPPRRGRVRAPRTPPGKKDRLFLICINQAYTHSRHRISAGGHTQAEAAKARAAS